jgi:hypothetical protein
VSELHNDAPNSRYVRRFTDPSSRPSNALGRYDEPTRSRITELVVWMDCEDLIAEAERAVRAESDRLARQEQARGWRGLGAGEPGD